MDFVPSAQSALYQRQPKHVDDATTAEIVGLRATATRQSELADRYRKELRTAQKKVATLSAELKEANGRIATLERVSARKGKK